MKPLLKPIFSEMYFKHDALVIVTGNDDLVIDDPEKNIYTLLKNCNGNNTFEKLAEISNIEKEIIIDFIEDLNNYGLIEDGSYISPILSKEELKKYRVNLNYFSSFSNNEINSIQYQEKLKQSTVLILGLGGYSLVATALAGLGIGNLIGVDFDTVEESNLNRQVIFNKQDIGILKSKAIEYKVKMLNPDINANFFNLKVTSVQSIQELIDSSDYVINGIDSPGIISSRWVNKACVNSNKPYFYGGVRNNSIQFFRYEPNKACYDCMLLDMLTDADSYYKLKHHYGAKFDGLNTSVPQNLCMLASLAINECTKYLTNIKSGLKSNTLYEISDLDYLIKEKYHWEEKTNCPCCNMQNKDIVPLEELAKYTKPIKVEN